MIRNFLIITFIFLFVSCKTKKEDKLIGDWTKIETELDYSKTFYRYKPFGIGFTQDRVEFFNGFKKYDIDSMTGKIKLNYKGTFTDYKIESDSIFIKNLFNSNWDFKWKIESILNDTLILSKNDSTFIKLEKIKPKWKINYDQIILSRSGCYGYCPIIDISIDKKGKTYFNGEGYVNPLGFFEAETDSIKTEYIFSKFYKVDIDSLSRTYAVGHTDDESITVTFVKNGQIIKTVHDYGRAGPKELVWSYVPTENLYTQINLNTLDPSKPFYPKLHYFTYEKDSLMLALEKSESFFLWTEINNSKIVSEKFIPKYKIGFRRNYTYWGPDPNEKRKDKYSLKNIESDGRYFKFSFEDREPIIYDLGYNFIERNFKEKDFILKARMYE